MYSLVLMAAVATSGDAASFHKKSAGCNGCYGAPVVVRSAPITYSVGCYGAPQYLGSCTGCTGCTGYTAYSTSCFGSSCFGSSCFGSSCFGSGCCGGGIVIWSAPIIETPAPPMAEPSKPAAEKKPASIEIEVPADATLFVDGQAMPGTGAIRSFSTPELVANKAYYYDMKAEVAVNGVVQREELRVVVRGGETLKQTFGVLIAKAKANSPTGVAQK